VIERRAFLKTLGLAGSAAAIESCAKESSDQLLPYLVSPDAVVAGSPAYYATTCRGCPAGCGLIAKSVNGRITKAEGNPEHPIGRGRLCPRGQATVQSVYNPYRFRQPLLRDAHGVLQPLSWGDAEQLLATKLRDAKARGRDRIAWLGRLETGPFDALVDEWLRALGTTRRLAYETFDYHAIRTAADRMFGRPEIPRYDFDRADIVLAFGAEFLETWISNVELTEKYSRLRARRQRDTDGSFVWVAPRLSLTGLNADAWLPVPPGAEAAVACAIANAMITHGTRDSSIRAVPSDVRSALERFAPEIVAAATGVSPAAIVDIARRFARAGRSVALGGGVSAGGGRAAVDLEVAVFVLNAVAGNIGSTVTFGSAHALDRLATHTDLADLARDMRAGAIDVLLVHHANPIYTLPAAAGFADALARVPFVVNFATLQDETTDRAHLVMPDHHDLESWGVYAPRDGIVGALQPAAAPLFDTRATADVIAGASRQIDPEVARVVGNQEWSERARAVWNAPWEEVAHRGGQFGAEPAPAPVALRDVASTLQAIAIPERRSSLSFLAYPTVQLFDGRHADASWLQELPDPVNQTVWGNCVEMHPETARPRGLGEGDAVDLASAHGHVRGTVHLSAGVHPNAIAMAIGYGRTRSMRFADARGANAIALLPAADDVSAVWRVDNVTVARAAGGKRLVVLQAEAAAEADRLPADAKIVRPDRVDSRDTERPKIANLYPPHAHPDHRWGMAIDLNACTGCSACVIACSAENNIAVVGPEFCEQGREMSWIRLERAVHDVPGPSGLAAPGSVFLPMLCQQCDNAPCEPVCPVYATYHNPEGLNAQVYARCIGTRFCSNNCPYKVRRFNWARYGWEAPLGEQLNPDVTVRSVGVMEKCTFCVQRIEAAKLAAKRDGRAMRDGDVVPACAQTCPADAIVFGDLHDPASRVSQLSAAARGYHALEELNTKPAITYLRRVVPGAPGT
jgi:anaerobic selenocysteine-containing dehydrogenase/Fe-S-cluster-containing dehydrogenase component